MKNGSLPFATDNPFIKDRKKAHAVTLYPSNTACRIVFAKGNASEVPPIGKHLCNLWKYDTVVFIWMDPRRLALKLPGQFISTNLLPLSVAVDVIVRPLDDEKALRSIALHFGEKQEVLSTCASAFLRERCKPLLVSDIRKSEHDLGIRLLDHLTLNTETLDLPFVFLTVTVQVDCPSLSVADAKHELDKANEAREHEIQLTKATHYLELLREQTERITIEQTMQVESAKVQNGIEKAKFETIQLLKNLSPEMLIVAMAGKPEIAALLSQIEIARATNDLTKVTEMLRAVGEAMQHFHASGTSVNMFTQK